MRGGVDRAALVAAILVAAPAQGQSVDAKRFGAREQVIDASISPDGSRLALVAPVEGGAGSAVFVAPADGSSAPKPILTSSGKPDRLLGCDWTTSDRLVCRVFFIESRDSTMIAYTRMVAVNADGSNLKQLTARATGAQIGASYSGGAIIDWLPDEASSVVLMTRNFVEEESTGRLVARNSDGKNLPAIVLPHGGPGARDEWGFDWLSQFYAARGFAVLQPNFRGSAGYGDAWFQKNGFQSWRTAVGDVNDAGKWLQREGIAAPGKLAIVGWSYGGYAALQSAVLDPDLFKAIVAIAPVTDLDELRDEAKYFTNFKQVDAFIGKGPHVKEGSPARNAERIKAPVLLFHGDKDLNVGVAESRLMASRLKAAGKQVDYVEFDGLDHQLADDAARTRMLHGSDAFLRQALGLPAQP